jgi:hypothetical protein
MRTIKTLGKAVLGVALVGLWGMAPGCGPSAASLCNKICDCTGCSKSQLDDCVDNAEDAQKKAEDEGCGSEYNALLSCANDEFRCDGDKYDLDGCDKEGKDYFKCLN